MHNRLIGYALIERWQKRHEQRFPHRPANLSRQELTQILGHTGHLWRVKE
ncbi:MAG: hypothetical protein OXD44_05905 [Gammaproteobacteria bacterium]|nr:hypothetical protein [Gammaproteobacteria bacterium]